MNQHILSAALFRLAIGAALILLGAGLIPSPANLIALLVCGAVDVLILWGFWEAGRESVNAPKTAPPVDSGKPDPGLPGPTQPSSSGPAAPSPATPQPSPGGDARFAACLPVTLKWEGGNDDDPRDPGGRTSRGITAADWADWRSTHPGLPADVWQAPQDQIVAIYKASYWEALSAGQLPPGIDLCVFDEGVLEGVGHAASALEKVVGTEVDAEIGPLTIAAAATVDPTAAINGLCDARLAYLRSRPNWPTYGNGWSNRVADVRKNALAMAAGKLPPAANIPAPAVVPAHLAIMRGLIAQGVHAEHDSAVIMSWPAAIAAKFPDMADYCKGYVHDSIPWCGLTVAYCMAQAGIRPVFGDSDTDKFLWSFAWQNWGIAVTGDPQPGDVMVFRWSGGGGHVTLYDHEVDDNYYHCSGGNQGSGHVCSTEALPMSSCISIRRAPK
jgi:lysozyme family protein